MARFDRTDSTRHSRSAAGSGFSEAPSSPVDEPAPDTASIPILSLSSEPELVLRTLDDRTRRFDRDDVVVRKGEIALINGHFTPHESRVSDLLALADALDTAGIDYLLVRGDHDRPVIAVNRKRRKKISRDRKSVV